MSEDFPTLSEVGEENVKAREKRDLEEWYEHRRFVANEYERL